MIADVPVGCRCRGGWTQAASRRSWPRSWAPARTPTPKARCTPSPLCYPGQSIDESQYVHSVERYVKSVPHYAYPTWTHSGRDHRVGVVPGGADDLLGPVRVLLGLPDRQGRGEGDPLGQRGDELLAGYVPYFRTYLSSAMDQHHFLAAVREVVLGRDLYSKFARELLQRRRPGRSRQFSMPDLLTAGPSELAAFDYRPSRNLNVRLADDVLRYSTPNLLRYEDKNSMAFSIESRVPFLDHELVEFIFQLPIDQKIKMGWNRYVYRQAMKAKMPELNRTRRSKIGFTNPETAWTRERALRSKRSSPRARFARGDLRLRPPDRRIRRVAGGKSPVTGSLSGGCSLPSFGCAVTSTRRCRSE